MPFQSRRAPLELTADIRATLETISRSRSEPVRDASDHAACLRADDLAPAASAPEGRALHRQGASAWCAGGVAGLAEVGAASADSSREPGLSRWLVKSRKTWVGVVDDEIAVAARRIVKSACRSWLRGRCGKFFLNRRSVLTKYRTNDGIQNRKMAEVLLFYKQIELLHEQETDTPLVAYISYDEKPGAIGKIAPDLPPVPGHYPRSGLRIQTPRNGHGGLGDRTPVRWSTGTEVGSSSPFSVNWTPATLPQPNFGWTGAYFQGNAGLSGDLAQPVRVRVHAEARAESRGVVLQQGGSYLASRSGFEGRTRGTRGTNRQPVVFKWTCKMGDTPEI